jgi:hypothetical protein
MAALSLGIAGDQMSKRPPVPKANRPRRAKSGTSTARRKQAARKRTPENLGEEGDTGNIRQNTTNQGLRRNR